jgi:hypothetical protein
VTVLEGTKLCWTAPPNQVNFMKEFFSDRKALQKNEKKNLCRIPKKHTETLFNRGIRYTILYAGINNNCLIIIINIVTLNIIMFQIMLSLFFVCFSFLYDYYYYFWVTLCVCVCFKGETLYIPAGWCHAVKNLTYSIMYGGSLVFPHLLNSSILYMNECISDLQPKIDPYFSFPNCIDFCESLLLSDSDTNTRNFNQDNNKSNNYTNNDNNNYNKRNMNINKKNTQFRVLFTNNDILQWKINYMNIRDKIYSKNNKHLYKKYILP